MSDGDVVALRGVRVFDGDKLTPPRTVVIDHGVISEDDSVARPIDAQSAVLLPGLIDAHVHLREAQDLEQLARWGVTTGLDMGCWPHDRVERLRTATTGRADFRTAGLPAIGPAGPHSRMPGMPAEAVVRTPDDARGHVAARVAEGVDYYKLVAEAPDGGGPTLEAMTAAVDATRRHGLTSIVHASSVGAYTAAVASGADAVTHAPVIGRVAAADVAALARPGRFAVPTAVMMAGVIASGVTGGRGHVEDPLGSIAALHRAGIPVLAGTDANAAPGVPAHIAHGESLHDELELLVRAGLSSVEALRAATSLPAHMFGLKDRGAVRPGLRADLVLVDGDPVADIRATRRIRAVWCAGVSVDLGDPDAA